ncbi:MAG: arginine biosynthesis bifunctional protein ArgJ [Pirellulaceae bacterium]|nr:MAG: arginine biosynthesis bifunctional protein ArgJ [Pirellulaceae bacterium]GIW94717.1 MAG: arginine biosynthesis bifunctional protein ArgJ [Pirellulaceae bacterium]
MQQHLRPPAGFRLTGVSCGIKQKPGVEDLTLIVADKPCVAAGVYTQNVVRAAPVEWDRRLTPSDRIRAVVANSGNANACTGPQGWQDTVEMARLTAEAIGAEPDQVLVMSTGMIGDPLPMEKIRRGIRLAADSLGEDTEVFLRAARGILTTDRSEKIACQHLLLGSRIVQLVGFAKGAGMIGPHMATMLAVIMTDAVLDPPQAQQSLQQAVDASFNCISVEGHMSTNDTVLLLSSAPAGRESLSDEDCQQFTSCLTQLCIELACMIPDDGEGASHLIEIHVRGCRSRSEARAIARSIANSPLVKCAIAGGGPFWGRILSAAGYAGIPFNPDKVTVAVNGITMFQNGQPAAFDAQAASDSIRNNRKTIIELSLSEGHSEITFWTSDLTVDYVRFNADYRT